MHWCAVVGTAYRLKKISVGGKSMSRNVTVIVVIILVRWLRGFSPSTHYPGHLVSVL